MAALDFRLFATGILDLHQQEELRKKEVKTYIEAAQFIREQGWYTENELAAEVSQRYHTPYFDLNYFDVASIKEDLLKEKLSEKHQVLPLFLRGRTLFLATVNPSNVSAQEDFQFSTGYNVEYLCVEASKLQQALETAYATEEGQLDLDDFDADELSGMEVGEDKTEETAETTNNEDAPIIVYINKILLDAIRRGASDLHFEPYEKSYRIRFRIDGILHEVASPPANLATRLAARLKVMSRLDIAEKRKPQDGRIKLKISANKSIDFRVSTLPTLWGEKIVMRILDSSSAMLGIDVLGYEQDQKQLYLDALNKPQGMILVTGPTGSGKTVSLYTGLNILNTPERNISTAEDPVEINLEGINQVQMNPKAGLTFSEALRSFLRQDPDIVMVGEIRDLETAEIAIKAAQTGHLVLSTLHTNSAPETLTRLLNMGVPSFNIASSVSLIIAQRLARRLCKHCKQPLEVLPTEHELLEFGFSDAQLQDLTLYEPVGCELCSGGFKGRVGIYEVMPISSELASIIMREGNALEIAAQAQKEQIANLRQSGIKKAISGLTSLGEVSRVTSH
ncbi:type IV-A pilus assembly ATPase PilB [Catenovulum agarivorans DS-2]|uniref:Type IV-A pilus assembly ATPase PilB n=1 Tax=Catenovulum agarivorans DS-2 TaxID=1328313 RepID=W7QDQ3_9ALTE|nr:type IV-A pilus assembly ATPase PilB [Catenovulum agarivorans]EWH10046.1 type IV-A pilus assembly ATPase PilB [Catenovulum agarivorans DS-2]